MAETVEHDALTEVLALREQLAAIHTPVDEEAEFFHDDEPSPYCDDGCTYENCAGHIVTVQVCSECGYTHDDDRALFRAWPCPTVRALATHEEAPDG